MALKLGEGVIKLSLGGLNTVQGGLGRLQSKLAGVGKGFMSAGLGAKIGLVAMTGAIYKASSAIGTQELMEKRLEHVLKTTGNTAGFSAKHLKGYAAELQQVTRFGDETTLQAMALIASMKNIRGDHFKRATEAAQDMAETMGTDLQTSARQVAMALEDPERGALLLRRAMVNLDAEQQKVIKSAMAAGDVQKAQGVILDAIESKYKGAAKAGGDTFSGAMAKAKNAVGDTWEVIGKSLVPTLQWLSQTLAEMMPKIDAFINQYGGLVSKVILATTAIVGTLAVLPTLAGMFGTVAGIVGPLIGAIGGIPAALIAVASYLGYTAIAGETFAEKMKTVGNWVAQMWAPVAPYWQAFASYASDVWTALKVMATNWKLSLSLTLTTLEYDFYRTIDVVKHFFVMVIPGIFDWFVENWYTIWLDVANITLTAMENLGSNIKNFFTSIWDFVASGGTKGWNFAWTPMLDGFQRVSKELGPYIDDMVESDVTKNLRDKMGGLQDELSGLMADALADKNISIPVEPKLGPEGGDGVLDPSKEKFTVTKDSSESSSGGSSSTGLIDMAKQLQAAAYQTKSPEQVAEEQLDTQKQQLLAQRQMAIALERNAEMLQRMTDGMPSVGALG